jgi:predicted XRE-type DNA-binding protein
VYVLHVFRKKSKSGIATPRPDRELVLSRFKAAATHYEQTYGSWTGPNIPASRAMRAGRRDHARRAMSNEHEVHDSSGNIFRDMGMRDAEERLAKAELARIIRKVIRERALTQGQAAEILRAAQPDVSDLMRGKLSRFSRDRLERFLNALDIEIRIQVGPRPSWKERAGITVEVVGSF